MKSPLIGFLATFLLLPVVQAESETSDAPAQPSLWVSSVVMLDDGQAVAGVADGLLLRPSRVIAMSPDAIGDVGKQAAATTLYEHEAAVWCVTATKDGKTVASLDYRGNLGVYDVAAKAVKMHAKAGGRWCQSLVASPDDQSFVFGNEAGELFVWSIKDAKETNKVKVAEGALTSIAFSPDGGQLAVTSSAGHVHFYAWPAMTAIGKAEVGTGAAWSTMFLDNNKVLVGSNDRHVYAVEPKDGAKAQEMFKATDWVTELMQVGGEVYVGEVSGKVHRMRLGGSDSYIAPSGVWALAMGKDGKVVAGTRRHGLAGLADYVPPPVKVEEPKKEEPAMTEEKKEEPAKEEPKKEEPKKEEPAKEEPKKEEPAKEEAKKEEPAKEEAKKDEAKPEPAK
jgi:WD40 repeat protein